MLDWTRCEHFLCTSLLGLAVVLQVQCTTATGGGGVGVLPSLSFADDVAAPGADASTGVADIRAPIDGGSDAFAPIPVSMPAKCTFGKSSCTNACLSQQCAVEQAACDATLGCKAIATCVKNDCDFQAWECIAKCEYKTQSAKAGKAYLALMQCAADLCIEPSCGDGACFGAESPETCPQDCRSGAGGPGSCAGACGTFVAGAACQCDKICGVVGDCCADLQATCQKPDIVLVLVSGHNLLGPSRDYLSDSDGAGPELRGYLQGLGLTVHVRAFVDEFHDHDDDGDGKIDRFGFTSLVTFLHWVAESWGNNQSSAARVVLVGHSHGAVWAHMAASLVPELPIRYLVSLDGVCLDWPSAHANEVIAYVNAFGNPWGWQIWEPCNHWDIAGLLLPANTDDVVFDNVVYNLEVHSGTGLPRDLQWNHRLSGSTEGISGFTSQLETHSGVHLKGSTALDWVTTHLLPTQLSP